jgi:hypothetical protein
MEILPCRRICIATRGCTSSSTSNEAHILLVECTDTTGTPEQVSEIDNALDARMATLSQAGVLAWPDLPCPSDAAISEDANGVRRYSTPRPARQEISRPLPRSTVRCSLTVLGL